MSRDAGVPGGAGVLGRGYPGMRVSQGVRVPWGVFLSQDVGVLGVLVPSGSDAGIPWRRKGLKIGGETKPSAGKAPLGGQSSGRGHVF